MLHFKGANSLILLHSFGLLDRERKNDQTSISSEKMGIHKFLNEGEEIRKLARPQHLQICLPLFITQLKSGTQAKIRNNRRFHVLGQILAGIL